MIIHQFIDQWGFNFGKLVVFATMIISLNSVIVGQDFRISLDELFDNTWTEEVYNIASWEPREGFYTIVRPAEGGRVGNDILEVECETGKERILIGAQNLKPDILTNPIQIEGLAWDKQGSKMLLFTNSRRMWRANTKGDYWVYDVGRARFWKIGGFSFPASVMFAEFSPDGRYVSYIHDNNLYMEDCTDGKVVQFTFDGSPHVLNGIADWVYEEEFGVQKAYKWSPDGTRIAFYRFDTSEVGDFILIDNLAGQYPRPFTFKYPKVGTCNSKVQLGIIELGNGKINWLPIPEEDGYLPRILWDPSGRYVYFQWLNRRQNTNRIYRVDVNIGRLEFISEDTDTAWVELVDGWHWLDKEGRFLLWRSEKSGWARLYRIDTKTGQWHPLTPDGIDVVEVVGVKEGQNIYFIASPNNPTHRYLYQIKWDGGGLRRLTPLDQPGWHEYNISPDGIWAIHKWSKFDMPPRYELIELPTHKLVRVLEDNSKLCSRLTRLEPAIETGFFRVYIDEALGIDGWYIRPAHRVNGASYPLIVYVYGEPATQTVIDRWAGFTGMWHRMLAQMGYVVISFDNRGTPAPRGRQWRKSIYGKIGIIGPSDQAKALKATFAKWPWLDPNRVGIWGWSGGGTMTLHAMFQYPELYHVGIAVAPVADLRLYDTIYQERYMGPVSENPIGYLDSSPIFYAKNLKGQLLIIHGTGDDNVHYQITETLINELVAWNKHFWLMIYPQRRHSINEGMNTRRHLFETMYRFLSSNLRPGPIIPSIPNSVENSK